MRCREEIVSWKQLFHGNELHKLNSNEWIPLSIQYGKLGRYLHCKECFSGYHPLECLFYGIISWFGEKYKHKCNYEFQINAVINAPKGSVQQERN